MEPYQQIFPDAKEPNMTLELSRKVGRIPKGKYTFFECYCTDPGCDCRRATILVVNEKGKQKAAIGLGFDPDQPLAGPFLEDFEKHAPYADELLDLFVDAINENDDWLAAMYDQYRAVRRKVEGRAYRGKAFPKPGKVKRQATPSPDIEAELERMMRMLDGAVSAKPQELMASFLDRYLLGQGKGAYLDPQPLHNELRNYLLSHDRAGDELAELLVACSGDDDRVEACLHLLSDALELLRVGLERRRQGSRQRMERLQGALARRVFLENGATDLCAAVTHILLQSRVELLPVLHEANQRRMLEDAESSDSCGSEQEVLAGLFRSIEEMGLASPFEGVEAMLQLFALADPGIQVRLCTEMLAAGNPLIREIAALMLFHPCAEVRLGVSGVLAQSDGRNLTPDLLRRLIVARNWFGAEIRSNVDRAIGNARRALVECAPLARPVSTQVYASVIDAAGAQSFQVIVPDGKGFSSCALLFKQGVGVADAFVIPLKGKRELKDFLGMTSGEASFLESTPEYLDQRLCHALAEGARLGNAPSFWLVCIAEMLGRDQWKGVEFSPRAELARLRGELSTGAPKLLSEREAAYALADSADWPFAEEFANAWFEDDLTLDRAVEGAKGRRGKRIDPSAAVARILDDCLSERRELWLERLVVTALWLRSVKKPSLPWHRMFHVAEALADLSLPLKEIPLMLSVAELSLAAYFGRRGEGVR